MKCRAGVPLTLEMSKVEVLLEAHPSCLQYAVMVVQVELDEEEREEMAKVFVESLNK